MEIEGSPFIEARVQKALDQLEEVSGSVEIVGVFGGWEESSNGQVGYFGIGV